MTSAAGEMTILMSTGVSLLQLFHPNINVPYDKELLQHLELYSKNKI